MTTQTMEQIESPETGPYHSRLSCVGKVASGNSRETVPGRTGAIRGMELAPDLILTPGRTPNGKEM